MPRVDACRHTLNSWPESRSRVGGRGRRRRTAEYVNRHALARRYTLSRLQVKTCSTDTHIAVHKRSTIRLSASQARRRRETPTTRSHARLHALKAVLLKRPRERQHCRLATLWTAHGLQGFDSSTTTMWYKGVPRLKLRVRRLLMVSRYQSPTS